MTERFSETDNVSKLHDDLDEEMLEDLDKLEALYDLKEKILRNEISNLERSLNSEATSKARVEAALAGTKTELEAARVIIKNLTTESERKSKDIQANLKEKAGMMKEIRWGESERRKLHNRVQELKGNIRVFCR